MIHSNFETLRSLRENLKSHTVWCDIRRQGQGKFLFHCFQNVPRHNSLPDILYPRYIHIANVREKWWSRERVRQVERDREGSTGHLWITYVLEVVVKCYYTCKHPTSLFSLLNTAQCFREPWEKKQKTLVSPLPPLCLSLPRANLSANLVISTFKIESESNLFSLPSLTIGYSHV